MILFIHKHKVAGGQNVKEWYGIYVHTTITVVVVVVVEMNIIKVALSHCCCKTTVQCH